MVSRLFSETSNLVSTDIGFALVKLQEVYGYDVEDVVRDKAISQAKAIQMLNLGKSIDPTKAAGARTINSVWLNNNVELLK